MPYCRINGRDITKYILMNGLQPSENDLDSPKSGRVLDGVMHRGKVAQKNRFDVKLVPVEKAVLDWIMPILRNQYFVFETDLMPGFGALRMQMYNSTRKPGSPLIDTQKKVWYVGASFNIIER